MNNKGIIILYEDLCEEWLRWMAEGGINTLGVHKIAVPGSGSVDALLADLEKPDGRRIIDEADAAGINVEFELHAMEWLMPRSNFAAHPDWFRQNEKGERTPDLNMCPSSAQGLEVLSENAYKLAKALRQRSHKYYLWFDDAMGGECQCESCRAISAADKYLLMLSAILRGLRAYDSDAMLSYLAYASMTDTPTVKPEDGIFLEFAPMDRDHFKPIADPAEERGARWLRALDNLLTVFSSADAQILEYWLDNALYSGYKMPPVRVPLDENVLDSDVRTYTSRGIRTIKTFGSMIGRPYIELYGTPPIRRYGEILSRYL